ncbi:MAG: exodeoxyribonuclease III, partial [Pseudomonadota bacterium]
KIASWNVNSLNVRLPHVLDWLAEAQPDVLALQETKMVDEKFPVDDIKAAGFHVVFAGQKTYNGVAILSREEPNDIHTEVPGITDGDRRTLSATINGVRIINLYVVNGQDVGTEKYRYKLEWLNHVTQYVGQEAQKFDNVVILGDFNIAPEDRDIHDPEAWHEQILCSTPEREALGSLLALGFTDTFRLFDQAPSTFSWWDYRRGGFRRNRGLRIDLVLASGAMSERCQSAGIDIEPRRRERPSDHTPVFAEFNLA